MCRMCGSERSAVCGPLGPLPTAVRDPFRRDPLQCIYEMNREIIDAAQGCPKQRACPAVRERPAYDLSQPAELAEHEVPVLLGFTLVIGAGTVAGSLLADLGYAIADPRVRYRRP